MATKLKAGSVRNIGGVIFTFEPAEDPQVEDSQWSATIDGEKYAIQICGRTHVVTVEEGEGEGWGVIHLAAREGQSLEAAALQAIMDAKGRAKKPSAGSPDALLALWRKEKSDGAAQVYRDAAMEAGIKPLIASLAELKARAADSQKAYPQYNGAFDSYTLCRVKATTVTKMGRAFVTNEITIAKRELSGHADGPRVTAWSFANSIGTGLFDADVEMLPGNYAEEMPPPPIKPMEIELRSFHANERFSEETLMFDAVVYIDGKRAGTVRNDGRGGSNDVHLADPALHKRMREYIESLPPVPSTLMEDDGVTPTPPLLMTEDFYFSLLAEKIQKDKRDAAAKKKWAKFAAKAKTRGFLAFVAQVGHPSNYREVLFEVRKPEEAKAQADKLSNKYMQPVIRLEEVRP